MPQLTKAAANYQNKPYKEEQCSGCEYFQTPSACRKVEGKIEPQGWCRLFEPGDEGELVGGAENPNRGGLEGEAR